MSELIDAIINDVAELPDRNSPEDWPDAMLVTMDELHHILNERLRSLRQPAREGWVSFCGELMKTIQDAQWDTERWTPDYMQRLRDRYTALQSEEK